MIELKRQSYRTPPEKMVNVNTAYLREAVSNSDISLPAISIKLGFCPEYLGNSIGVGRINRDYLIMLSSMLKFPMKEALEKKKTKKCSRKCSR